ncbi:multiple sugar transport system substrate-binding protein [Paenibacillus sp. 1_12]|uniref:ABC transporter substrate-binding protein n=1 Tax=Paenibacillus sp. 1_12 TaxID=1566278 RepID=UPI0008EF548C|nr:sugar ABC transporter substrate-binding protein [Paenibacillus sp. 1_12]SFL76542.1 multiple sugar transport system substrate-binding protein [Paenibacillus sp. 1_12]
MFFKKGLTIAVNVLLVAALSACGGSDSGQKQPANGDSANSVKEKVTLRFAYWGGELRNKKYTQTIADFEKKYPHIKIEQEFADSNPYYDKLAIQAAGGNLPDVMSLQVTRFMDYANRNQLLQLDEMIQSKAIDVSDFNQKMIDAGKANGKVVMVANGNTSKSLFYNSDLLKRANVQLPKFDISWEEFAALGAEYKKAAKNPDLYFVEDPSGIDAGKEIFGFFLRQKGKDVYTKDGKLGFEKQDMIEWFQYWDKLRKEGIIPPAALTAEYKGKSQQESMLVKGQVAATLSAGGSSNLPIYQTYMKDQLEFGRVPTDPKGKNGEDIGGLFLAIGAKSKYPKESALFVNYLINDVEGAKIFKIDVGPSPSKKINEAVKSVLEPSGVKMIEFQQKANEYFNVPNIPPAGNNEIFKQLTTTSEAIAFGKKPIEKAVEDFFNEANKILK